MKYSHFLCTLERSYQDKLKLAIIQLKCVPCLNKFTATSFNLIQQTSSSSSLQSSPQNSGKSAQAQLMAPILSNGNMNRLLKQMSLIVSTELQQIAIDLIERYDDELNSDKPVKYIRLKEEFKHYQQQHIPQQQVQHQQMSFLSQGSKSNNNSNINNGGNNSNNNNNNNNNTNLNQSIIVGQPSMRMSDSSKMVINNNNGNIMKPIGSNIPSSNAFKNNLFNPINMINTLNNLSRDVKGINDFADTRSTFIDHSASCITTANSDRY